MAILTADQIYQAARHAGFSPDQSVTMTAIALAESQGKTDAHNPNGEDSWGLWQINFDAHPHLAELGDRTDPLVNARMAFEVSGGGSDIGRWTVTHADKGARYLDFRDEAERAARLVEPNEPAIGSWDPPQNYHSGKVSAGGESDAAPPGLPADLAGSGNDFLTTAASQVGYPQIDSSTASEFLQSAIAQDGDEYVFGAETQASDLDPDAFDCSELVQWAAAQAGVELTDGSWLQYQHTQKGGGGMTVQEALQTPGALLFRFGSDPNGSSRPSGGAHVAISLGDGRTIEARGRKYGVGFFDANDRGWTHAGMIPEIGTVSTIPTITDPLVLEGDAPTLSADGLDSDGDEIFDSVEIAFGTNPFLADSDQDGFDDGVELLDHRTDALDGGDNPLVFTLQPSPSEMPNDATPESHVGLERDGGGLNLIDGHVQAEPPLEFQEIGEPSTQLDDINPGSDEGHDTGVYDGHDDEHTTEP